MPKSFPKSYLIETPSGECEKLEFDRSIISWSSKELLLKRAQQKWSLNCPEGEIQCVETESRIICGEYNIHCPEPEPRARPRRNQRAIKARVGDSLKRIIKSETGAVPKISGKGSSCSCNDLAKKMNQWGISGCESRKDEIVSQLVESSKDLEGFDNLKPIYKIGSMLPVPSSIIKKIASGWLDRAIETSKAELIQEQKKKRFTGTMKSVSEELKKPLDPAPFNEVPTATLLFHCYPTRDSNWRLHVSLMKTHAKGYSRKIMSIAIDEKTVNINEVKDAFGDEWEYITVANDPALREVISYREMFKMAHSLDPNNIIVCAHGKGAQPHTVGNPQIEWWTKVMYETVVGNLPELYTNFEKGYQVIGSFRRIGRHFGCRYRYHFSGTFYALRSNSFFLPHGSVPRIRSQWWGTESLPGDTIPFYQSKCIVGDMVGDMYREKNHPIEDYEKWKAEKNAQA